MEEQKQQLIEQQPIEQLQKQKQQHPHCQHKYLNNKFNNIHIEILFDQQLPINLDNCILTVQQLVKEEQYPTNAIKNTQTHSQKHLQQSPTKQPQTFILINYHPTTSLSSSSTSQTPTNTKRLQLLIPLNNIICVAKKSIKTTLIMVKDKQKVIQFDQNGYQLVSDQEEDQQGVEQFQEVKNLLYQKIKKNIIDVSLQSVVEGQQQQQDQLQQQQMQKVSSQQKQQKHLSLHHHNKKPIVLTIDSKCTIMLSQNISQQTTQITKNLSTTITTTTNNHNHILKQKPIQQITLYNFLSHKLQQYQKLNTNKQINKNVGQQNQWRGSIQQMSWLMKQNGNDEGGMDQQCQFYQQQQEIDDQNDNNNQEEQQYQQADDNEMIDK